MSFQIGTEKDNRSDKDRTDKESTTSSGSIGSVGVIPPVPPLPKGYGGRPSTSSSDASDPFGTPKSSRAPSLQPDLHQPALGSSSAFFPIGPTHAPRSILSNNHRDSSHHPSALGVPPTYGYSSARSSTQRMSHFASANSIYGVLPTGNTGNNTHANGSTANLRKKETRMKSNLLPEDTVVEKPWKEGKDPRAVFSYWIVYVIAFLGIAVGAVQCYFTVMNVQLDKEPLCIVLDEDFSNPDTVFGPDGTFQREVRMDGFGNGQFEMTTDSQNNSFVMDGKLYIVPTLTSDNIGMGSVLDGTVYNITGCTFNDTEPDNGFVVHPNGDRVFRLEDHNNACSKVSNATQGAVINPVQSARLTTQHREGIRFGRVEIKAKMPQGDWLWPAMWMMPKDSVYGPWPMSGEIDIVESRGNSIRYTAQGSNYVQGSLNWGPAPGLNGVDKSHSWWSDKRKSFGDDFHTYVLEWTPKFLRIFVDSRLHTLLDLRFNKPFFDRAEWPASWFDGQSIAPLGNPWKNGTNATPFDQEFFLILNVAVGGTNGWFPEQQGDKPWLNGAGNAQRDFLRAIDEWYPTWGTGIEQRALVIDYVKMWKHCKAPE